MTAPVLAAPRTTVRLSAAGVPLFCISCNCGQWDRSDPRLPYVEHYWRQHVTRDHEEQR